MFITRTRVTVKSSTMGTPWIDSDSDTMKPDDEDASGNAKQKPLDLESNYPSSVSGAGARSNSSRIRLDLDVEDEDANDNDDISTLKQKVNQIYHELSITRDAHQLSTDQSNAEIHMLRNELNLQKSCHEQIVSKLRNKLVESEMARTKLQDQVSTLMEDDVHRAEVLKIRFDEMSTRILDNQKWADEELKYWKNGESGRSMKREDVGED